MSDDNAKLSVRALREFATETDSQYEEAVKSLIGVFSDSPDPQYQDLGFGGVNFLIYQIVYILCNTTLEQYRHEVGPREIRRVLLETISLAVKDGTKLIRKLEE